MLYGRPQSADFRASPHFMDLSTLVLAPCAAPCDSCVISMPVLVRWCGGDQPQAFPRGSGQMLLAHGAKDLGTVGIEQIHVPLTLCGHTEFPVELDVVVPAHGHQRFAAFPGDVLPAVGPGDENPRVAVVVQIQMPHVLEHHRTDLAGRFKAPGTHPSEVLRLAPGP